MVSDGTSILKEIPNIDKLSSRSIVDRQVTAKRVANIIQDAKEAQEVGSVMIQRLADYLSTAERSEDWEIAHGALLTLVEIIDRMNSGARQEFVNKFVVSEAPFSLVEEPEVRMRETWAELLGKISATEDGEWQWNTVLPRLLASLDANLEKRSVPGNTQLSDGPAPSERIPAERNIPAHVMKARLIDKGLVHDTEGWKELETSFLALQRMLEHSGNQGGARILQTDWNALRQRIDLAFQHTNRFVRQSSQACLAALCQFDKGWLIEHGVELAGLIRPGLADNWSQVRLAASTAARSLVIGLEGEADLSSQESRFDAMEHLETIWYVLVPAMCLNRYYVAEGVRLYSIETWRRTMGRDGPRVVAKYAGIVADFYCQQSGADNHAVREAACYCMAEMATKIDHDAVKDHVSKLLDAMELCFRDQSWPVRDAACTALGDFVKGFPEESRSHLDSLYTLWIQHLADNINSVRADSAVALGKALDAYGEEMVEKVYHELTRMLPMAKEQPSDSKRFVGLEKVTQFGVAAPSQPDEEERHTNQQMYSCGSLAPKLKRGSGCMDHGFQRPKEPWESSDGAVYLLREFARVAPEKAGEFVPMIAEIAALRTFAHFPHLLETIWKQVPAIATAMGKRNFKRVLQHLIDPLVDTLECDNRLAMDAAGYCIELIAQFVGPQIFSGRLTGQQRMTLSKSEFVRISFD